MTVKKLNKRAIYWSLVIFVCLLIPALVSLTSFSKEARAAERQPFMQAPTTKREAFAISGVEKFPESYDELKQFEDKQKTKEQALAPFKEALAQKEQELLHDNEIQESQRSGASYRQARAENEGYDRYHSGGRHQASRSEIMFINNVNMNKSASNPTNIDNKSENDLFFKRESKSSTIDKKTNSMVSAGTLLDAILLTEINTDLPGPIIARVSHNIWDSRTGKKLLIPQNSKLIGEYNASVGHGQKRAQIHWHRIIFPNQQSIDLKGMVGVDKKGASGVEGNVDNHYDEVFTGLMLSTMIGGGVRMSQGKYDRNEATITQEVGNSLAKESAQLGNKIADRMLNAKPTITVPIGQRINVFVEGDLVLQPYED